MRPNIGVKKKKEKSGFSYFLYHTEKVSLSSKLRKFSRAHRFVSFEDARDLRLLYTLLIKIFKLLKIKVPI